MSAGFPQPGQLSAVQSDGDTNFMVFLPSNWRAGADESFPVLLYLHGGGGVKKPERVVGQALGRILSGVPPKGPGDPTFLGGPAWPGAGNEEENRDFAAGFPFITLIPVSNQRGWQPQFDNLMSLLDKVAVKQLQGDPRRVYLAGQSMGGNGAWGLSAANPGKFAAIAPFCGFYSKSEYTMEDQVPAEDAGFLSALKDQPIWTFHAEADGVVAKSLTDAIVDALRGAGAGENLKYTVYEPGLAPGVLKPGDEHGCYEIALKDPELWAWMLTHTLAASTT